MMLIGLRLSGSVPAYKRLASWCMDWRKTRLSELVCIWPIEPSYSSYLLCLAIQDIVQSSTQQCSHSHKSTLFVSLTYLLRHRDSSAVQSVQRPCLSFESNRRILQENMGYPNMADEITNLNGGSSMERGRLNWKGALAVFLASFGVFALAIVGARSIFPRSVSGRASSSSHLQVVPLKVDDPVLSEDNSLSTLAPVHVTTKECTGDRDLPAVRGVDVVAYFSLEQEQPAVYGSDKHSTEYHGYLFFFSSLKNKIMFESNPAKYLPAWGGFCSYGISHEVIWDPEILGPKSNPDFWLIIDDQLYLFRSSVPLGKFTTNMYQNIDHGNSVWHEWFGADDRDVNAMTPFNTACFCTTDTCVDQ